MKKFFTVIISIVMLLSILSFTVLLSARSILSEKGIEKMLNSGIKEFDVKSYIDEAFNSNSSTDELSKYIDDDAFYTALNTYITEFIKYAAIDDAELPSSKELRIAVEDALDRYAKANDLTIDRDLIDEVFETFDGEMKAFKSKMTGNDEDVRIVFEVIYGDYYLIALCISVVCLIVIFLININIVPVFTSLGVVMIINGVLTFGVFAIMVLASEEALEGLADLFGSPFRNAAIISLILGVVLLVAKSFIKNAQNEKIA